MAFTKYDAFLKIFTLKARSAFFALRSGAGETLGVERPIVQGAASKSFSVFRVVHRSPVCF